MCHLRRLRWSLAAAMILTAGVSTSSAQGNGGGVVQMGEDEGAFTAAMEAGERVFASNCSGCHGEGQIIGENTRLESIGGVLIQIIEGGEQMPPFGRLMDSQVAAVATFVRNSFGNSFGIVTEADVAEWRL